MQKSHPKPSSSALEARSDEETKACHPLAHWIARCKHMKRESNLRIHVVVAAVPFLSSFISVAGGGSWVCARESQWMGTESVTTTYWKSVSIFTLLFYIFHFLRTVKEAFTDGILSSPPLDCDSKYFYLDSYLGQGWAELCSKLNWMLLPLLLTLFLPFHWIISHICGVNSMLPRRLLPGQPRSIYYYTSSSLRGPKLSGVLSPEGQSMKCFDMQNNISNCESIGNFSVPWLWWCPV